jgi:hypothetical protein
MIRAIIVAVMVLLAGVAQAAEQQQSPGRPDVIAAINKVRPGTIVLDRVGNYAVDLPLCAAVSLISSAEMTWLTEHRELRNSEAWEMFAECVIPGGAKIMAYLFAMHPEWDLHICPAMNPTMQDICQAGLGWCGCRP